MGLRYLWQRDRKIKERPLWQSCRTAETGITLRRCFRIRMKKRIIKLKNRIQKRALGGKSAKPVSFAPKQILPDEISEDLLIYFPIQ